MNASSGPRARRAPGGTRPGTLLAACALLLAACTHQPAATPQQACGSPAADRDWPVAASTEAGFDAQALCKVLSDVASGDDNIHALLVERGGRLVAELYRSGPDSTMDWMFGLHNPFAPDTAFDAHQLHDVRSVSKSITSLVVGIEIDKGRLPGLRSAVLPLEPGLADLRGGGHDAITLEHLLTMSSGLEWQEWGHSPLTSDEVRLFWKEDTARFVMDRPLLAVPGTTFRYSGGNTQLLADLLQRGTGKSVAELAQEDLFAPLGIAEWQWVQDLHGHPIAFAGLRLRPRDMLKFARLVNQRGTWQGRQLVPAAWIEQSTRTQLRSGYAWFSLDAADAGYGYQWWTGRIRWQGRELDWASAVGNGGQRIFVVPALDLGVVMTGGDYGELGIHRAQAQVLSRIVAAVVP